MRNKRQKLLISLLLLTSFVTPAFAFAQEEDELLDGETASISVDLKINGQDERLTVPSNTRIVISWESEGAVSCKVSWSATPQKIVGRITGKISASRTFTVTCRGEDGAEDSDSIRVTVGKQGSPAPTSTGQSSLCNPFSRDVSAETDLRADEIVSLGKVLFKSGLYPTVTFDKQDFATGVADFQVKYGIRKTGTLDSGTRAKLNSLSECVRPPEPIVVPVSATTPTPTPASVTSTKPSITNVAGKAAGNFEIDAGGLVGITGLNLLGGADTTKNVQIYIGGSLCTIKQASNDLIYCIAPIVNLKKGLTYPLHISAHAGMSNTVNVKVLSVLQESDTFPSSPASSKPLVCGQLGDVNVDGGISSADSDLARKVVTGAIETDILAKLIARGDVNGDGTLTTLDISLINGYLAGTQTTFPGCASTESGFFQVLLDSSTPVATTYAGGTLGVVLGRFTFASPVGEAYQLKQIALEFDGLPYALVNRRVGIFHGNTEVGEAVFPVGNHGISTLIQSVTIPAGESVTLTIKGDLSKIGVIEPLQEGTQLRIGYDGHNLGINGNYAVNMKTGRNVPGSSGDVFANPVRITASGGGYIGGITITAGINGGAPTILSAGSVATLSWSSSGAQYCSTKGDFSVVYSDGKNLNDATSLPASGSKIFTVPLSGNRVSIILTCYGASPAEHISKFFDFEIGGILARKPLVCGQLGDVNMDGVISSADADKIKLFAAGGATPTADEQTRADVNASGSISTLDSTLINGYLAGTSSTFSGCSVSASVPPPTVDLKIDGSNGPVSIASGAYITPSWNSTNASYCNPNWSGDKDSAYSPGVTIGPITAGKTYTVTCYSSVGASTSDSVEVTLQSSVPPPPPPSASPSTPDSLSFTAGSASDDKSSGSTFAPGGGADWSYTATLSLGSAKTIKSMRIVAGGEVWTTMPEGSYWNIVIFDGGTQINSAPADNLNLAAGPGSKSFTLYTQKWNQTFNPSYTLSVAFTDGTTLTAPVSGSPLTFWHLFEQFASALASLSRAK